MKPERWKQVREILNQAIALETGERPAFLNEVCAADTELRLEVESLLRSHEEAGSAFLKNSAINWSGLSADATLHSAQAGRIVGAYRIIEEIGQGGMGEVYRAVRADGQYEKEVAIKLVRSGLEAPIVIERFRQERQILASLDHPHIARLLDGGTTEEGIPYLVMELIEGTPIDRFADAHALNVTRRLELFRQVCAAVQYAHQRLVIHRDVKPSNIMVTEEGLPKLLDFGIAKILDPAAVTETTLVRPMTPEYASPEQIRGEPITTSSDVYSLGVVLYRLLTGLSPYAGDTRTPHELERAICEVEPQRPSTAILRLACEGKASTIKLEPALTSGSFILAGEGSIARLQRRLRGDIDTIVLKAVRKEPQHRYTSVEQFAEDLWRHLEGLPISARKGSWSYRAGKFVERHKAAMVAVALIFVAILGGVIATFREAHVARAERRRAEKRFNDVRQLADSLMFTIHDSLRPLPGTTQVRMTIVQNALQYLDSLAQESSGDLSLQRELAAGYEKIGDVRGRNADSNLGDTAGALESYRKAFAIRKAIASANPKDKRAQADLAKSYDRVGSIEGEMGKYDSAFSDMRRSLEIHKDLAGAAPTDQEAQFDLALSYDSLGNVLAYQKDFEAALAFNRNSLKIFETLAASGPQKLRFQRDACLELKKIGGIFEATGKLDLAMQEYQKALRMEEKMAAENPPDASRRRDFSITYRIMGDVLLKQGATSAALKRYREAITIDEALAAADPGDAEARRVLIEAYNRLGDAQTKEGDFPGALVNYGRALKLAESRRRSDPSNAGIRATLAASYSRLGTLHFTLASQKHRSLASRKGELETARSWHEKSLNTWRAMKKDGTLRRIDEQALSKTIADVARCASVLRRLPTVNPSP